MRRVFVYLPLLLVAGCGLIGEPISGSNHPCVGNRTDALWSDSDATVWVGCGTTASGTGLYRSDDVGVAWAPVAGFESFRSTHIHRASNGTLYIAGTDTAGSDRVRALDSEGNASTVFASQGQTWNSFHAGSFAALPNGVEVAESLTGVDLAWRASNADAWQDGYAWSTDGSTHQILDMVDHAGTLVAVGSTITEPPLVFVADLTSGFTMSSVQLGEDDGELWTIDSDGAGLIAGGANQVTDVGILAWTSGDPGSAENWEVIEVDTLVAGATWVRGVCRSGDRLAAAAEFSTSSTGLLLVSSDGGATWRDETPDGAPALSQCTWRGDDLLVVGADGYFRAL